MLSSTYHTVLQRLNEGTSTLLMEQVPLATLHFVPYVVMISSNCTELHYKEKQG